MNRFRILIVDDDPIVCEDISTDIDQKVFNVDTANDLETALDQFSQKRHHIVLADLKMEHEDDGFILLGKIRKMSPSSAVLIVTGHNDVKKAVKAMQLGAIDYITKPFETDQLLFKIKHITERINLQEELDTLRRELTTQDELVGNSEVMQELRREITIIAKTDSNVLISGPNGSGKELVARAIYRQSKRHEGPFVAVNCAAITDTLIESELFGTVKGAFTGALNKKGKFELADHGTLFLDEVGDMNLATQAKVLRVIDQGTVSPLGSETVIQTDVRIIAATNKDLVAMVQSERFREDLYYRLNVIPIETRPLRDRPEDIPMLVQYFLMKMDKMEPLSHYFTSESIDRLVLHDWPGNVRELLNIVQRLMTFCDGAPVRPEAIKLPDINVSDAARGSTFTINPKAVFRDACFEFEKQFITRALKDMNWNIANAAKRMDIQRQYLYEKLKKLGIKRTPEKG